MKKDNTQKTASAVCSPVVLCQTGWKALGGQLFPVQPVDAGYHAVEVLPVLLLPVPQENVLSSQQGLAGKKARVTPPLPR
jgi:hypothetical protein